MNYQFLTKRQPKTIDQLAIAWRNILYEWICSKIEIANEIEIKLSDRKFYLICESKLLILVVPWNKLMPYSLLILTPRHEVWVFEPLGRAGRDGRARAQLLEGAPHNDGPHRPEHSATTAILDTKNNELWIKCKRGSHFQPKKKKKMSSYQKEM